MWAPGPRLHYTAFTESEGNASNGRDAGVAIFYDPDAIRQVVGSSKPQLKRCYDQTLAVRPELVGKVSVRWIIDLDGRVASVNVVGSTVDAPELGACIVEVVKSLRFPAPAGGGVAVVTYPFVFKQPGVAAVGVPDSGR